MNVAATPAGLPPGREGRSPTSHGALLDVRRDHHRLPLSPTAERRPSSASRPTLATFGKGLANGYPVSAVAGRRDVMKIMEEIFFSFTFGGEALVARRRQGHAHQAEARSPVTQTLAARGQAILDGARRIIDAGGLGDIFAPSGHPSWSFLNIRDARGATAFDIKTLWMQELMDHGILSVGTHNVSFAHTSSDVEALLAVYREVLPMIGNALDHGTLRQQLRCKPLEPLFKLR
jgi:glutamate-1-semialdehyde 2,1-aminomutase